MPHSTLTAPMACTGCGHRVPATAAFCRHCGQRLGGAGRRLALDLPPWPPPLELPVDEGDEAATADTPRAPTAVEVATLLILCAACFPAGATIGVLFAMRAGRRRLIGIAMVALSVLLPAAFVAGQWRAAPEATRQRWLGYLSWRGPDPGEFLRIDDVRLETNTAGDTLIHGTAVNVGSRPVRSATLMLTLRDEQGAELWRCVIPVAGDEVEGYHLPPRGAADFTYRLPGELDWQGDYSYHFCDFRLLW